MFMHSLDQFSTSACACAGDKPKQFISYVHQKCIHVKHASVTFTCTAIVTQAFKIIIKSKMCGTALNLI